MSFTSQIYQEELCLLILAHASNWLNLPLAWEAVRTPKR